MAGDVREIWSPKYMTASGAIVDINGSLGGFFCSTAGNVLITAGLNAGGATIVASFPAVAGTYYPLPFKCNTGAYAALTTAVGTFAIGS